MPRLERKLSTEALDRPGPSRIVQRAETTFEDVIPARFHRVDRYHSRTNAIRRVGATTAALLP